MLLSDICLSVAYIGPNLKTERPRKTKTGTEVAHITPLSRSKVNLLLMSNSQYAGTGATWWINVKILSSCRGQRHIVSPRAQLDIISVGHVLNFQFLTCSGHKLCSQQCSSSISTFAFSQMRFCQVMFQKCSVDILWLRYVKIYGGLFSNNTNNRILNRKVLSLDLKIVRESLMRTVCGSEFQTVGAEDRKSCVE